MFNDLPQHEMKGFIKPEMSKQMQIPWISLKLHLLVFLQSFGLYLPSIQLLRREKKPYSVFWSPMSLFPKLRFILIPRYSNIHALEIFLGFF